MKVSFTFVDETNAYFPSNCMLTVGDAGACASAAASKAKNAKTHIHPVCCCMCLPSVSRPCEHVKKLKFGWVNASFETAAEPVLGPRTARTRGRPPQDEEFPSMPSLICLMVRSAHFETPPAVAPQDKLARLEPRTAAMRPFSTVTNPPGKAGSSSL